MFLLQSGNTFQIDCTKFWDAVADAKHPRPEEALPGVNASRARLMNEVESQKKEVTQVIFSTKKVKNLPDDTIATSLEAAPAIALKVGYDPAARTALQKIQQELATKEVEQLVRSELENTESCEKLDTLEKSVREEGYEELKK